MSRSPVSSSVDERARAIERIYEQRYASFRRAVSPIVGDYERAHDAVQEGFARALARRETYRGGSLEAWVWRIVLRKAYDLRGHSKEVPLELAFDPGLIPTKSDPALAEAIASLPARRRLVVFLRYFGDLSYDQIGDLCGISVGTVAATLSQAHDDLRETLDLEGVER